MKRCLLVLLVLLGTFGSLYAQSGTSAFMQKAHRADSTMQRLTQLPDRYFDQVNKKAGQLQSRLTRQSEKALRKVSRQEEKMRRKLAKVDSLAAHNIFTRETAKLRDWQNTLEGKANGLQDKAHRFPPGTGNYLPYLDTLKNALGFLKSRE